MPLHKDVLGVNVIMTLQPAVSVSEVLPEGADRLPRRIDYSSFGMETLYVQYTLDKRLLEQAELASSLLPKALDGYAMFCKTELEPLILPMTKQMVYPVTAGLVQLGVRGPRG